MRVEGLPGEGILLSHLASSSSRSSASSMADSSAGDPLAPRSSRWACECKRETSRTGRARSRDGSSSLRAACSPGKGHASVPLKSHSPAPPSASSPCSQPRPQPQPEPVPHTSCADAPAVASDRSGALPPVLHGAAPPPKPPPRPAAPPPPAWAAACVRRRAGGAADRMAATREAQHALAPAAGRTSSEKAAPDRSTHCSSWTAARRAAGGAESESSWWNTQGGPASRPVDAMAGPADGMPPASPPPAAPPGSAASPAAGWASAPRVRGAPPIHEPNTGISGSIAAAGSAHKSSESARSACSRTGGPRRVPDKAEPAPRSRLSPSPRALIGPAQCSVSDWTMASSVFTVAGAPPHQTGRPAEGGAPHGPPCWPQHSAPDGGVPPPASIGSTSPLALTSPAALQPSPRAAESGSPPQPKPKRPSRWRSLLAPQCRAAARQSALLPRSRPTTSSAEAIAARTEPPFTGPQPFTAPPPSAPELASPKADLKAPARSAQGASGVAAAAVASAAGSAPRAGCSAADARSTNRPGCTWPANRPPPWRAANRPAARNGCRARRSAGACSSPAVS
eukprot:scaffold1112_cov116-Isochrysis_galbana.AAC.3